MRDSNPIRTKSTLGKLGMLFGGVLASKFLGLARELLLAFAFGTSFVADAFRVALGAVLIPTHLLTGDALASAFIPAYKRLPEAKRLVLARVVATALVILSLVLTAVLIVFASPIARALAPGFGESTVSLCAKLIRVAAAGIVLYSLSAILIDIQIAHDQYLSYSIRPTVQNVGLLAAIAAAYSFGAPVLLGLGFVAAFVAMTGWSAWEAKRSGLALMRTFKPKLRWTSDVTSEFRQAMGQLSLFVILAQVSAAIDRLVGSLTGVGGVASLDYAFFITDSTRFIVALPLATLVLGRLSGRPWPSFVGSIERVLGFILVLALGLSVFIWSTSSDIVEVLYRRGQFQEVSTLLTTASLKGFAVGMWATTGGFLLMRAFSAALRNREVAAAGAAGLVTNIVLDLALYRPLGVLGIALATSISSVVIFALLLYWARLTLAVLKKAAIPGIAVSALAIVLPGLSGAGFLSLALAGAATLAWTALLSWLWRPIRQDVFWLARRSLAEPTSRPDVTE